MNKEEVLIELKQIKSLLNVRLENYTHSKTGGNIPAMFYPHNVEELKKIIKVFNENSIEFKILGGLTNIVVASGELNFNVINMSEFESRMPVIDRFNDSLVVKVPASCSMKFLSKWAVENSINGLQWMEGIPGTVGAGVFMNAGFLPGQDFRSVLVDAEILMPDYKIITIKNSDMDFSYRKSILQKNGGIVLFARLLVRTGKKWKIALRTLQYHKRRAKHQPLEYPSAGTVFVPPMPYHVGGMIPKLGLVEYTIGGAQISRKSPGFIINIGNMTGEDYFNLIKYIQNKFFMTYGISLEPEVRLLGFSDEK